MRLFNYLENKTHIEEFVKVQANSSVELPLEYN